MRFSFPTVIVALAVSTMFVSASEVPTSPGEEGTLDYNTLPEGRDLISGREFSYDTIKRTGRFARRGALVGVSGLSKRSEQGEIGERSKSKHSDGVGHRRSERGEVGEELKSKSSDGVGHRRSERGEVGEELKSKSSDGVGHRRSERGVVGEELGSKSSDGVGH